MHARYLAACFDSKTLRLPEFRLSNDSLLDSSSRNIEIFPHTQTQRERVREPKLSYPFFTHLQNHLLYHHFTQPTSKRGMFPFPPQHKHNISTRPLLNPYIKPTPTNPKHLIPSPPSSPQTRFRPKPPCHTHIITKRPAPPIFNPL